MIADRTRRLRAEASGDWIELAYRGVLYTLADTALGRRRHRGDCLAPRAALGETSNG